MALKDKILRFLITHIPIKGLKEHLKKQIFVKFNFYGYNNKVTYIKNGKETELIYNIPQLKIWISGNNNKIQLGCIENIEDSSIYIYGDNNIVNLCNSKKISSLLIDIQGSQNNTIIKDSLDLNSSKLYIYGFQNHTKFKNYAKLGNSTFDIVGNYNITVIKNDIKLKDTFATIKGNYNRLNFSPALNFENVLIFMGQDRNLFYIKTTPHIVKEAKFYVEDGSRVYIGENAELKNGNLYVVANGNYKTKHKLVIGNNVRLARDTIIRTSDGHTLIDPVTKIAIDEPKDVIIGNNVWVASRCIILKGAQIPDNSMVGAMSLVNKPFLEKNVMLVGIPAKIRRHNICWVEENFGEYMERINCCDKAQS